MFVDECHRTQSGDLHEAMKAILPNAMFIGFTGTPLLKADKQKSIEVFGRYIHTYKFDQAVREGVVLDLRYEARDIDQSITSQRKIDEWFEAKTKGLNDLAKAQLKQKWGTDAEGALQPIAAGEDRRRHPARHGDARPRLAERPRQRHAGGGQHLRGVQVLRDVRQDGTQGQMRHRHALHAPVADAKGEDTGEGETEQAGQVRHLSPDAGRLVRRAGGHGQQQGREVREGGRRSEFVDEPGQMKLLIVVDKLLTGFDAPPATYLYIDKPMRDHGLFQAICRVNRLDGEDKEYGYIIDYKDLFKSLEGAVADYTSGAFDGYDKEDVDGLLEDRLHKAREDLEEAREAVRALCEPVEQPKDSAAYLRYFCAQDSGNAEQLKDNEPKRLEALQVHRHAAARLRQPSQ